MVVQFVPLSVEYSSFTLVTLVLVHVILWDEFPTQLSPPTGDVILTTGTADMVKTLALTEFVAELLASLTLTLQFVDTAFGTLQEYVPALAAVLATIVVQFEPLSVEYSSFTLVTLLYVQVIL